MARTLWQTVRQERTHYVQLTPQQVIYGSHGDSEESDEAGACSHQEFLQGRFHDGIRADLGEPVLQEVLAQVRSYQR